MRRLITSVVVVVVLLLLMGATLVLAPGQGKAAAGPADSEMCSWRVLMIIFRDTDTDYLGSDGRWHHMTVSLTQDNIDAMLASLTGPVAAAVRDWSNGQVRWEIDVRYSPRPITSLSAPSFYGFQDVTPETIGDVIDGFSPDGVYDQIMVYWAGDKPDGTSIPHAGWGLSFGYQPARGWCYLTVEEGPTEWWNPSVADQPSQVWIHEWLHCAASYYGFLGYPMPAYDADGAEYHGYVPNAGGLPWHGKYYADLMQSKVLEDGRLLGITEEAWLDLTPHEGLPSSFSSWTGDYYANRTLSGSPLFRRIDETIAFDWGEGSPGGGLPADNFSVRWTTDLDIQGTYKFFTRTDDGVRLYVDGELVIDRWVDQPGTTHSAVVALGPGTHALRMEYYESGGAAAAWCWWTRVSANTPPSHRGFADVPVTNPYHQAIHDLASLGIVSGYGNGLFGPFDSVTRQQFAKMIVLGGDLPVSESDVCFFQDVANSGTASLYPDNYIAVCASHGITVGKTRSTFDPYANITGAQVLSMVVRAAQDFKPGAVREPPAGWKSMLPAHDPVHGGNIARAEYSGLLAGVDLSAFSVEAFATRGEIAQIIWNLRRK